MPCDRRLGCDSGLRTRWTSATCGEVCYAEEQSDQENIPNDISDMVQPQQNCLGEQVLIFFSHLHQADHSLVAIHLHTSTILIESLRSRSHPHLPHSQAHNVFPLQIKHCSTIGSCSPVSAPLLHSRCLPKISHRDSQRRPESSRPNSVGRSRQRH